MAVHSARGARRKPRPQVAKMNTLPSPVGGVDGRVPVSANNPNVCLYAFNVVPSEYGLRVRNGYREWAVGVPASNGTGVGTIIPFTAADDTHRLFAVSSNGIYDVTDNTGSVVEKLLFNNQGLGAGVGVFTHYLSDAGDDYLFYADGINGLFRYSKETDIWEQAPNITGVDVTQINFIVSHKLRLWFCIRDEATAYYLPISSIAGEAEPFAFGSTFKHGGNLVGLYSWTVDGGAGVDDYLVGLSRAGDVIPFQGSDPTSSNWSTVGTYFVGALAHGNRCASQYGGNLTLLSSFGITQLSDLLRGVDPTNVESETIGAKIATILRNVMDEYRNEDGWDVKYLPSEGALAITAPQNLDGTYIQYVYNITTQGWGFWRGLAITSIDTWRGVTYFGDSEGRVCAMDVAKDNILLEPDPNDEFNGVPIPFSLLTSYGNYGSPSMFKIGQTIRPDFLTTDVVSFAAKFTYDYDLTQGGYAGDSPERSSSIWDGGLWDSALWSESTLANFNRVGGGAGMGRYVAVAINGTAVSGTIIASMDITWTVGKNL